MTDPQNVWFDQWTMKCNLIVLAEQGYVLLRRTPLEVEATDKALQMQFRGHVADYRKTISAKSLNTFKKSHLREYGEGCPWIRRIHD